MLFGCAARENNRVSFTVVEKMRSTNRIVAVLAALCALSLLPGCRRGPYDHPDLAVVQGHMIATSHNYPPVRNDFDYSIIDVDGHPIINEKQPPLLDMQPGALVGPGKHRFKVSVTPIRLPPNYVPQEVHFTAIVEAGKRYFITSRNGLIILVEERDMR